MNKFSYGKCGQELWLAPLRGVTIRAFRMIFAPILVEKGFTGVYAPFIPANPGLRVTNRLLSDLNPPVRTSSVPGLRGTDRLLSDPNPPFQLPLVPQAISRHPEALRELLRGFKDRGFRQADLNAGCPFPMIVRRGRGAGLFKTPDILEKLVETGCDEMGEGNFSVKIRLGLSSPDELKALMPRLNRYPLARLVVHGRTARQGYAGTCDVSRVREIAAMAAMPVVYNGDAVLEELGTYSDFSGVMIGRGFIRHLGMRSDASELLKRYAEISAAELPGDVPVLGRLKELVSYWRELQPWRRVWPVVKISRTLDEFKMAVSGI